MKNIAMVCALLTSGALQIWAGNTGSPQPGQPSQTVVPPPDTPFAVIERGANHRVWEKTSYEVTSDGKTQPHKHRYTELATGMNYLQNGQWVESKEIIEPYSTGAIARQGQYQVIFANNLNSTGTIDQQTSDGKHLRSNILGLEYYDKATGQMVLIAQVQDSEGQIISVNQVLYPDAFQGVKADVRYTYQRGRFEQDVILRDQPPTPEAYGLNSATTVLEVVTEFLNPPTAEVTVQQSDDGSPIDEDVNWGGVRIGRGKAFDFGGNRFSPLDVPVIKHYVQRQGRWILLEQVPFNGVRAQLSTLPQQSIRKSLMPKIASTAKVLPPPLLASREYRPMKLVSSKLSTQGYVLDYVQINTDNTNYVFQGGTTYYISGYLNLYGNSTVEGGTVLKFPEDGSGGLVLYSNMVCQTGPYQPAIFTSINDNTVGENIGGSSGSPAPGNGVYVWFTEPTAPLRYLRMLYGYAEVVYDPTTIPLEISDSQFLFVTSGGGGAIYGDSYSQNLIINNVLFSQCDSAINTAAGGTLTALGSFVTADQDNAFFANLSGWSISGYFTNSIFTSVGYTNGLILDHSFLASNGAGIYQAVGAGSYYLATNSSCHVAGTTNVDPGVLADIFNKTTWPPLIYSNLSLSVPTTFSPQVPRDTNVSPDLGYHYDALDYAFGGVNVYSNLTFTAGTGVGWFELPGSGGPGYGISIFDNVVVSFNGLATAPCVYARYSSVQEGGNGLWQDKGFLAGIAGQSLSGGYGMNPANAAQAIANFSRFYIVAGGPNQFREYNALIKVSLNNCEMHGIGTAGYWEYLFFTNSLFERCALGVVGGNAAYMSMRNCTFKGGLMYAYYGTPWPVWMQDCAFDGTDLSQVYTNSLTYCDYCAVVTNLTTLPVPGAHDVIVTNCNWQSSWFGNFYLPTNSPFINAGNTTADQLGLYHFTTQTNQTAEANSIVDIGYHYVATDAIGNPLDSNENGTRDYLEDANGNGVVDNGETNWALAILTQPTSQTAYVGNDIAFNMNAVGIATVTNQWYINSSNLIVGATNASLPIYNVQLYNATNYFVVVSDAFGSVTSTPVTLSVVYPWNYVVLNGALTNFTFQGNTTYYVNSAVQLYGVTTVEGGTVIKYGRHTQAQLTLNGPMVSLASAYAPVFLSTIDDNTMGVIISQSTGNPIINTNASYLVSGSGQTNGYKCLRVNYAGTGILGLSLANVWDSQFLNCGTGVASGTGGTVALHNVLISKSTNCVFTTGNVTAEQVTADQCQTFCPVGYGGAMVTNSLLTGVQNTNGIILSYSVLLSSGAGIYQNVIGGSYYLATNTYQNVGTTNISLQMLADISGKTTCPPLVVTNTISTDTVFSPVATRDNDAPDIGYHYDSLDYILSCLVTNAAITMTNGVAIGYIYSDWSSGGILYESGKPFVSQGTATKRNTIVHFSFVEEGVGPLWTRYNYTYLQLVSSSVPLNIYHTVTNQLPSIFFRDTTIIIPAWGNSFPYAGIYPAYASFTMRDCELLCNNVGASLSLGLTNIFQNNLVVYPSWYLENTGQLYTCNNLFRGDYSSYVQFANDGLQLWTNQNNAFDNCESYMDGTIGHNAYLNGATIDSTVQSSDVITNLTWQSGWFGNYYQPTNSPLINAGSTTADQLGLYHYTTQTNQTVEGNSTDDIGYHYVATDAYGNPVDSNGNGIPDYIEDSAGTGAPFSISLIAPTNDAFFGEPATILLMATVFDWRNTVTNVTFLKSIVSIVATTNAPYSYTWPVVAAGAYTLTAIGQDNGGIMATSAPVYVTITNLCGY